MKRINVKLFTVMFILLTIMAFFVIRGNEYCEMTGSYEESDYLEYFLVANNYDNNGSGFNVSGDDPQLILDLKKSSNGIRICFNHKIDISKVQIFYANDEFVFKEENSIRFEKKFSDMIEILSMNEFRYIRIDIDTNFQIKSFSVCDTIDYKRIVYVARYIYAVIINIIVSLMISVSKKINILCNKAIRCIYCNLVKIKKQYRRFVVLLALLLLEFSFSYIVERILLVGNGYFNRSRMLILFGVIFVLSTAILFRKYILNYLHIYFMFVIMLIGTIHIVATPPSAGISWDDEIHYINSSYVSWLCSDRVSVADVKLNNRYATTIYTKDVYSLEGRSIWVNDINSTYQNETGILTTEYLKCEFSWSYVAYIPTAIGLAIGRGLGLSFTYVFMLGKFVNLLCYSILFSTSIYMLKNKGKILVSLIGLIPTSIFMACSYSYDWWFIGCVVLGYSLFFDVLQREGKISTEKHILITCILMLGIFTKAVYFPILFPMMLMKKEKYENSKLCRGITIVSMLFLLLTFLMPVLFGAKEGDSRGGSNVNSMKQIGFILSNPIEYTKILLNFLREYLSLKTVKEYTTVLSYLGQAKYTEMVMLILTAATIIDNNKTVVKDKYYRIIKVAMYFSCFASIVLVSTALYVSFTPVGYETINGCQPRYILPLLFPLLYYFGDVRISVDKKVKNNFVNAAICIMSCIFLYATYAQLVVYY